MKGYIRAFLLTVFLGSLNEIIMEKFILQLLSAQISFGSSTANTHGQRELVGSLRILRVRLVLCLIKTACFGKFGQKKILLRIFIDVSSYIVTARERKTILRGKDEQSLCHRTYSQAEDQRSA